MAHKPKAVAFDVLQTLFGLDALKPRLQSIGLPPSMLEPWFARILRDGFALAASNVFRPFAEIAPAALLGLAQDTGHHVTPAQVKTVMPGFGELLPHDDVAPAFAALRAAGVVVAVFSNGSEAVMRQQLASAKLTNLVQQVISVDDAGAWKPRAQAYQHAVKVLGQAPADVALVAAHSWDCHGAARAGLTAAWVRRQETHFNPVMDAPAVAGDNLMQVVDGLLSLS